MADPISWGTMLMATSAAISAVGAIRTGNAQAAAANYNAQVASQNAQIANAEGAAASEAQSRGAARKMGAMVAGYGASGVQGGEGSPLDVLTNSARMATLDNLTTQWNYKLKGIGYQNQSTLDSMNASYSSTAGYLNAAGDIAGGGSKAFYMSQGGGGSPIPMFGG